jgi:hypothetical protein
VRANWSRRLLDTAIRKAAPAVWVWDAKIRKFLTSEGLRALYSVESSAPFGLDEYVSVTLPDDRTKLRRLFEQSGPSGLPEKVVYRVLGDDGESLASTVPTLNPPAAPMGRAP